MSLNVESAAVVSLQDTIPPAQQDTLPPPQPFETLPDTVQADTITVIPEDFTDRISEESEEERIDTVEVWRYQFSESFSVAETDSSLRWRQRINLFDRYHQEKGAITYRMGTKGRMDAMDLHAYETRHINLELHGLQLNDPLTGNVNWNRMPFQKIYEFREADFGATYRSQTRLRDHYLTQPRTYLNFDESHHDYRNLDFIFTQNFRETTNVELSFWDRRDGGGYNRSGITGRQAAALVYHQVNDRWMLKGGYINNAIDRDESFGYLTPNPQLFSFNRFIEIPNRPNAFSNQTSSDAYIQAHHRPDKFSNVSTELGLHYQTDKWSLTYPADTLATDFKRAELFARQYLNIGSAQLSATARGFFWNESANQNLTENNFAGGSASLDFHQHITQWGRLSLFANAYGWDDSRTGSELSGKLSIGLQDRRELSFFGGVLSKSPDIQSLYWQSAKFLGSSNLLNEETITAGAEAKIAITNAFSLGVRGDVRNTENAAFVDTSNTFVNIDPYSQLSGTGWIEYDSRMFEGMISATYKKFTSDSDFHINQLLNSSGDRTWIKGHLYWKSYLFDRATFVTAGLSGVFSPNAYRTAEYITPLNRWQHSTNINRLQAGTNQGELTTFLNPSFYRVDIDVSARVRWFMVLLKWENILDRVNQLGYFETTGYPMPEQRFIFSLRILFTN